MKTKILLLCLWAGLAVRTHAQELKIGDKVPNLIFSNLLNYKSQQAKLSDFSGKLVILDFWNTGCGPCIAAFPKLDSLQRLYNNRLVIIPIAREKTEVIKTFIARYAATRNIKLTMSFENQDRVLESSFPHATVPHQVWISPSGFYLGATQEIESKILQGILAGQIKNVGETNTKVVPFNLQNPSEVISLAKPIFNKTGAMAYGHTYNEVLTSHIEGIDGSLGLPAASPRIFGTDLAIADLYALALGVLTKERRPIPSARRIIETKDKDGPMLLNEKSKSEAEIVHWLRKNTYCYDLLLTDQPLKYPKDYPVAQKLHNDTAMSKILLETLSRQFPYKVKMEKREVECLVFRVADSAQFKTKGGQPYKEIYPGYMGLSYKNVPLSTLINNLRHSLQKYIVFDDTNYMGNVDIEMEVTLYKVNELSAALAKQGISLNFEKRIVEMMVITDK